MNVVANAVERLPSCDGVRTDAGVDSGERVASILWCTSRSGVNWEVVFFGRAIEIWLCIRCCKRFKELLVWFREAVIKIIPGGPKRV